MVGKFLEDDVVVWGVACTLESKANPWRKVTAKMGYTEVKVMKSIRVISTDKYKTRRLDYTIPEWCSLDEA